MQILTLGNELLRKKAKRIETIDAETESLAKKMFEILKKGRGVGLAGPQVGVMKRIFVTDVSGDNERVFINPSILETSHKTEKCEEGCLSIPGTYANVIRSQSVRVQAWNEKGKPYTIEAEGLLARVIQHENDHLNGVLFVDHLPEQKREKLVEKYRKNEKKEESGDVK